MTDAQLHWRWFCRSSTRESLRQWQTCLCRLEPNSVIIPCDGKRQKVEDPKSGVIYDLHMSQLKAYHNTLLGTDDFLTSWMSSETLNVVYLHPNEVHKSAEWWAYVRSKCFPDEYKTHLFLSFEGCLSSVGKTLTTHYRSHSKAKTIKNYNL